MKITYLKLRNFATIYTAMNKKEIEIDFSKCKNDVVLLVGPNGSGKTSILSSLHPFAYAGSMDIRNNASLLREDKDGYKEIHIDNDGDLYVICHFYKNTKRGITVKSFIKKNDVELNPNGNVTSFNDTVRIELSLESDFLRLLRLGSNVSNLIDMKATERKNFTSDLLSDINVYNELHKKITDDTRVLRNLLKTVSDKITKLNVVDKDLLISDIKNLEKRKDELSDSRDKLQKQLGAIDGKMMELVPEGLDELRKSLYGCKDERDKLDHKKSKLSKDISNMCIVYESDVESEVKILSDKRTKVDGEITVNKNMILFYKEKLNDLYDQRDALTEKLKSSTTDVEYTQLMRLKVELSEKISKAEDKFKNYESVYTKQELFLLLDILKNIDSFVSTIREFDDRAIKKTIELFRQSDKDVDKYINDETKRINKEILTITSKFKSDILLKEPVIVFRPTECVVDNCPYMYIHELLNGNDDSNNDGLVNLESQKDILQDMASIKQNLDFICMTLRTNMNLISKGSIKYFSLDNIYSAILTGSSVYNEDYITLLISEVEDYDEYILNIDTLKDVNKSIELAKASSGNIDEIRTQLTNCDKSISEILKQISDIEESIDELTKELSDIDYSITELESLSEKMKELATVSFDINSLNEDISKKEDMLCKVKDLEDETKSIKSNLDTVLWSIQKIESELFDKRVTIKDFESLTKERNILNDKFDEIEVIRESLSSTKGIPLLFIQLYLKNTKMYVNDLLESVYGGDFEIDDFDINANEFNIPYIKNSIRVSDVAFASQGEQSFLSLALSFALITQSIKEYNILLLDEIDSTLDTKNRAMFLNILEKQMESINAEQVFLITHNNAFDNYPVDIILTGNNKLDNYQNANIIYSNN